MKLPAIDSEIVLNQLRWHKMALLCLAPLLLCIFLMIIGDWSGATGWVVLYMFGALGSLAGVVYGLYEGHQYRTAYRLVGDSKPPSHKEELRRLYKQQKKLVKEIHRWRNEPSLRDSDERKLIKLNNQIAVHRGLLPEE